MSTIEAAQAELALGQDRPKDGKQAAPHYERAREHEREAQQTTSELSVGPVFTVALVSWVVVPQLAWLGGLGYLAHRLLF